MRPRNEPARAALPALLRRRAPVGAAALVAELAISPATLHRLLAELSPQLVAAGQARRTRYALRRPLRGMLGELPVVEIDPQGRADQVARLLPLHGGGSFMSLAGSAWPVPAESVDGWWPGLPYVVNDMRPQGYLGRQLARLHHAALQLPPQPQDWHDDDVLHALSQVGSDSSGSLIVGEAAFAAWQATLLAPPEPLAQRGLATAYARLAQQAVNSGVAGSSAAGEFPKFPALRHLQGSQTPHVLVKFSGADGSAAVQRWADLLVCEHLALQCAAALPGCSAAASRVLVHAGRTFLEVERFDRHGLFGRSPLLSLDTADAALVGAASSDWTLLAARLAQGGWLDADGVRVVEQLWWFGRLIANTDMHTGNLSFRPFGGRLLPAPVYDMLPMFFAPLPGGEVATARNFEPPLPPPQQTAAWAAGCAAALRFWALAAADSRLSSPFRAICAASGQRLQQVADRVRPSG